MAMIPLFGRLITSSFVEGGHSVGLLNLQHLATAFGIRPAIQSVKAGLHRSSRSVLECGSPLPLSGGAMNIQASENKPRCLAWPGGRGGSLLLPDVIFAG